MNKTLIIILALAAFLRLFQLTNLPISLFGDEVDVGYHAYSLITTGRDYMGNLLPTYIQSLAEWRAPLIMYVTAPFIGIFGLTPFAVRLPAALLGILNTYLIYLLSRVLFKNKTIPLLAALLLAFTPWHIHYSRANFEVTLLLSLLLLGTYWFLKGLGKEKFLLLSPLPFILTFYTYSTANLFTPLLVVSLFLIYKPKFKLNTKYLILATFYLLLLIPISYQLLAGPAAGRFKGISIFNDQKTVDDIILQRTDPWVKEGSPIEKVFHNKPLAYLSVFGRQYLQSFSTEFLFLNGDLNFRHSVGRFGELLWVTAPLLLLGLVFAIKNSNFLLLAWLFLSPIPSALTQGGGNHATRLFIMLPPLVILSALGVIKLSELLKSKRILVTCYLLLATAMTFNVIAYLHRYASHYRYESTKNWHYGYESIFNQLKSVQNDYKRIFINNTYEPSLLRFVFYTKLSPKEFQTMFTTDTPKENIIPGFDGFKLGDKYYFGKARNLDDLTKLIQKGDLYLAVQMEEIPGNWDWSKDPPAGFKTVGQTRDIFGNPLFYLITRADE